MLCPFFMEIKKCHLVKDDTFKLFDLVFPANHNGLRCLGCMQLRLIFPDLIVKHLKSFI